MEKASPELIRRFDDLAQVVPEADRKLVFGSPTCVVGGHMFFGVHAAGLFVRLSVSDGEDVLAAGGAPFEPMPGRPMSGFFVLPSAVANPEQWVRKSFAYAAALPPKKPKTQRVKN